jgi:hypothetical protein
MAARDNNWERGYDRSKPLRRRRSLSEPRVVYYDDDGDGEDNQDRGPSLPMAAFEPRKLRVSSVSSPRALFEPPIRNGVLPQRDYRRRTSFEDRLPARPRTPVLVAPQTPYPRDANGYLSPLPSDGPSYRHLTPPRDPWSRIHYHKAARAPSPETLSPDVVERQPRHEMPPLSRTTKFAHTPHEGPCTQGSHRSALHA